MNLETSNLSHCYVLANLNRNMQNFPQRGFGLGHVTPKNFGIRLNISSKLLELESSNLVHSFTWGTPSERSNNFPPKGRGRGHVTPKICGIQLNLAYRQNYLKNSKLLQLESSTLVHSFLLEKPSGRANNFPQKGRGLGHVTGKKLLKTIPNILKII